MRRDDLQALEAIIMKEVVKRRALGGYSTEAEGVLILFETIFKIIRHLDDTYPRSKKGKEDGVS